MNKILLNLAINAARKAGDATLVYYRRGDTFKIKDDGSPVTLADITAHKVINKALKVSNIPVVSEECMDMHLGANLYWLVDPLDGTKDYLAETDEFTVNIALIKDRSPILGVIFAPALCEMYVGMRSIGAWVEKDGHCTECQPQGLSNILRMAVSRFHNHPDINLFASENNVDIRIAVGSALKYGRLAIGEIDVFPRLVGSSEWDTAAGQAILESAGGQVLDWCTGLPLHYGKTRSTKSAPIIDTRSLLF